MKLNNNALQELYDTILNGTLTFLPYTECPIDKAFRECDEKLSDSIAFAYVKDFQDRNDILRRSELNLLETNMELASKKNQLEKDLDDAKKQLNYFTHSRDDWRSRAKHAEKEVEDLKKELQDLRQDCNKLFEENRRLNTRTDCLRLEVNWYRKHYKEQSDKIRELKTRLNSMYGVKAEDLIEWNLKDFLNEHKGWQEKKDQERTKYMRDHWECTLEGTVEINKDLLNKICGIGSFADFDPEIRQKECFNEMYADMTVVDYPERFKND